MISNDVRTFLTGVVSDQLIDVYVRFFNLLDEKEIFTANYFVLELISTRNNYETVSWIHRLNDICAEQVDAILADFDIELTDEITVPESLVFLEAFFMIEHWEDQDRLISIIDDSGDIREALAEIISEISTVPAESVLSWIKSVSPDFIENILNLSKDKGLTEDSVLIPDDWEHYSKVKERYSKYLAQHKQKTRTHLMLEVAGYRLLTPFSVLLPAFVSKGYLTTDSLNPQLTAQAIISKLANEVSDEILGLAIISGESSVTIEKILAVFIPQLGVSQQMAMEIMSQANDKIAKVLTNG